MWDNVVHYVPHYNTLFFLSCYIYLCTCIQMDSECKPITEDYMGKDGRALHLYPDSPNLLIIILWQRT